VVETVFCVSKTPSSEAVLEALEADDTFDSPTVVDDVASSGTMLSDAGGSDQVLVAIATRLEICTLIEVASDVEYLIAVELCSITEVSKAVDASASEEVDA